MSPGYGLLKDEREGLLTLDCEAGDLGHASLR